MQHVNTPTQSRSYAPFGAITVYRLVSAVYGAIAAVRGRFPVKSNTGAMVSLSSDAIRNIRY